VAERRFRVVWAEAAAADLEELVAFVAEDSSVEAERLLERLRRVANGLESMPARGRVVPELARFGIGSWRELVAKPYRLVYRLTGDTVTVVALFDGRRDLEDVLLERLLRSR
jgi:plasmid stabilization system protein ParE